MGVVGGNNLLKAPPLIFEYVYYALVFHGIFGLVPIPLLGIGGYSVIAALSILHFGKQGILVYRPIGLVFGCAIFIVLVQLVIHEEELLGPTAIRDFITWAVALIVVQSLTVRKGFFHRFAIFAFFIGLGSLFTLRFSGDSELVRAGSESLGSANAVAMWYGFCFIYFLIAGLEAKNYLVRASSWAGGFLCFFVMGLTVSRGPLVGSAISAAIAFKRVLKRSFLPIVVLLFVCWSVFLTGLADNIIGSYFERGSVESGRSYLWRVGFARFLDAWWGGVGLSNSQIFQPGRIVGSGPHNTLLLIGLSSGVIPLILFIRYLVKVARGAFQSRRERSGYAPFLLPMFVFAMLEIMSLDWAFMSPWVMVVFATILSERNYLHLGQMARNNTHPKGEVSPHLFPPKTR